jgi:LPS export ABC transporter protein LptC
VIKSKDIICGAGIIVYTVMLFSCENDLNSVSKITATDDSPTEITHDLLTVMTDSGRPNLTIEAVYAEKYGGEFPKTEFSDGLKITFYDKKGEVESILTANYGEISDQDEKMLVRHNVIFENFHEKQKLKTEELFWDKDKREIFTDKLVTIHSEKGVFKGYNLKADESFTQYEMINFKGNIIYSETKQ